MKAFVLCAGMFLALLSGLSQVLAQSHLPSFNCTGRLSSNERLICNNANLANMDVSITHLYNELTSLLSRAAAGQVRSDQRNWVRQRQSCGRNYQCTTASMQNRISTLQQSLEVQRNFRNGFDSIPNQPHVPSAPTGKANCSVFNMDEYNGQCVPRSKSEMVRGADGLCRLNDEASNPNPCGPGFYQIRGRCISSADVHENTSFCGNGAVMINQQCFLNSDIQFRP